VNDPGTWYALILLGAYHGINPAMGWLFAVALGLQERRLTAVLRALIPIALGHEVSEAAVTLLVVGIEGIVAPTLVRVAGALILVGFGIFKLLRPRAHPRWVGMRVSLLDLGVWSFLMSSAHGAGLMLFPILMGQSVADNALALSGHTLPLFDQGGMTLMQGIAATLVHSGTMLLVMAVIAVVVYTKVGVGILRSAWINLDGLWAAAMVLAGVLTLVT
jgi:hypothetical protein